MTPWHGLAAGLRRELLLPPRGTVTSLDGTPPPARVVLDTNVVLSALVFGKGPPAQLRLAWQTARCQPLASTASVQELVRALAYPKFKLSAVEQQELLADYLPCTATVQIPVPPPQVPACRDPLDVPFLHLAVAGHALALVTGDRDLLTLAHVGSCPILSPKEFLASGLLLPLSANDTSLK